MSTEVIVEFLGKDRTLSSTADRSGRSMSSLSSKMKNFGKVAAVGLAAGVAVAGKALFDMTKAAAEDEAAQKRLATTLKNTTGATGDQIASVEDWITAQGKALGVSDDQLRPALEKLAVATGDVGKAQKLASLAMDVSAGTGKSLEQVSTALAKAQNGQVAGLSRLGISTKNAAGETISFEKAQRRMAEAFKGQASKQANTLQGKMARLKLVLAEAGEEIGAKLIPVVTRLADWFLNKALPALEEFGGYLQRTVPPIMEKVRAAIQKFTSGGSGDFKKFVDGVKGVIRDGITIVTKLWEMFGENIVGFVKGWFDSVKQIITGAFQVIKGIFKVLSGVLTGDWKKAWSGVKDILRGAKNIIVGLIKNLWNTIKFIWKNAGVVLKALTSKLWDLVKSLFKKGVEWVWGQIKDLPNKIKKSAGFYLAAGKWIIGKLWDAAKALVPKIGDWVVDQIKKVPERIKSLGRLLLEAGKTLISKLFDGIKSLAGSAGGFAGDLASSVASALVGKLNDMIRAINDAIPNSLDIPGPNIDLPDNPIPSIGGFAKGTRFARGGWAMVGENGPELMRVPRGSDIRPTSETKRILGRNGATAAAAGGPVAPVVVQLVLPGGKVIEQLLIQWSRDANRPLQVQTL